MWEKAGFSRDDLKKHIQSAYGKEHTADLSWKEMQEILELCKKEGGK
jgi:hypothetical protein